MDPNETYRDMLAAMKAGDHETARSLALALKDWFAHGGFDPDQCMSDAMDAYIASVLRRTAGKAPDVPFSLVCERCDAGEHIETEEQAIEEGWVDIWPALDLPQANYCGTCPECQK